MIRPLGKMLLTLGALALLASPAWAQGRGGFGFGGMGGNFLMAPNVQKDLKLSDEQVGKVQDTLREIREKHQDDFGALRDATPEERQEKMASLRKTMDSEIKKALALSSDQSKRYDQIEIQAFGFQAFSNPAIQEKLKLTDDQKSKVRELNESTRSAFQGFDFQNASDDERAAMRKKMTDLGKENMNKAVAMPTDSQKSTWKEMTGDPIDIQMPPRPNN